MIQSRTHNCNELRIGNVGERVTLVGWFENMRKVSKNLMGFSMLPLKLDNLILKQMPYSLHILCLLFSLPRLLDPKQHFLYCLQKIQLLLKNMRKNKKKKYIR